MLRDYVWATCRDHVPAALRGIACIVISLAPSVGLAQVPEAAAQTRTGEAEAKRREKAQQLVPNQPTRLEALVRHIEDSRLLTRIFDPPNGPFALLAVAEGAGFGGGGGYRVGNERWNVTTVGAMSLTQYWIAETRFRALKLADGRVSTELFATGLSQPREDFFGLGPDSSRRDRTTYAVDTFSAGGLANIQLTPWLTVTGGATYLRPDLSQGEDPRFPSTEQHFTRVEAPGLTDQPDFLRSRGALAIDTRDPRGNARVGGRYQASFEHTTDRETGHFTFQRTTVQLEQLLPFWNEDRVIALRVLVDRTDAGAGEEVPFYFQPTLGSSTTLRAYRTQRFRDRSALLVQAEYRYAVNPFLMAAVFGDAGQVAPDWGSFRMREFRNDVGFGLRFGSELGVALRTDVAFGDEGPRFHIRFSGVF